MAIRMLVVPTVNRRIELSHLLGEEIPQRHAGAHRKEDPKGEISVQRG